MSRAPASSFLGLAVHHPVTSFFKNVETYQKESRGFLFSKIVYLDYDSKYGMLTCAVPDLVFEELCFGLGDSLLASKDLTCFKFPWMWEKLDVIVPAGHVGLKFKCSGSILNDITSIAYPASKHKGQLMTLFVVPNVYAPFKEIATPGVSFKIFMAEFMGQVDENYVISSK
jgi:hypothetical protein